MAVDWYRRASGLLVPTALGFADNPLGRWGVCGSSCCDAVPLCEACDVGTTPPSLIVTISGLSDDHCTECSSVEGTFQLDQIEGSPCSYLHTLASPLCTETSFQIETISGFLGFLGRRCTIFWSDAAENQNSAAYYRSDDSDTDCSDMTDLSLPFWQTTPSFPANDLHCDWLNATVTVTAG